MTRTLLTRTMPVVALTLAATLSAASLAAVERSRGGTAAAGSGLSLVSARVTLEGTSNVHEYTASSTAVRLDTLEVAGSPAGDVLDHVVAPAGLGAVEVAIAATTLESPKDGINKNMHKALKAQEHPDIRFRLGRLEAVEGDGPGGATPLRATGALTIAGVTREVTLDLLARRDGGRLTVTGGTNLLMTDFGITPPKAMLGMLKTDPKVHVGFEIVLAS